MKHLFFIAITLLFTACTEVNTSGEKTITQGNDTISEVDISLSKMDAVEELSKIDETQSDKILFKASGSEPGWFAEISQLKIRVVVDYGKDSVIAENQGKLITELEDYNYSVSGNDNKTQLTISAINKPCVAVSGDPADRTVTISYKGKTYKGCGSFVK